jgi:hypothetical protein
MLTLAYPFPIALALLSTSSMALQALALALTAEIPMSDWLPLVVLAALGGVSLGVGAFNPELIFALFSAF